MVKISSSSSILFATLAISSSQSNIAVNAAPASDVSEAARSMPASDSQSQFLSREVFEDLQARGLIIEPICDILQGIVKPLPQPLGPLLTGVVNLICPARALGVASDEELAAAEAGLDPASAEQLQQLREAVASFAASQNKPGQVSGQGEESCDSDEDCHSSDEEDDRREPGYEAAEGPSAPAPMPMPMSPFVSAMPSAASSPIVPPNTPTPDASSRPTPSPLARRGPTWASRRPRDEPFPVAAPISAPVNAGVDAKPGAPAKPEAPPADYPAVGDVPITPAPEAHPKPAEEPKSSAPAPKPATSAAPVNAGVNAPINAPVSL